MEGVGVVEEVLEGAIPVRETVGDCEREGEREGEREVERVKLWEAVTEGEALGEGERVGDPVVECD